MRTKSGKDANAVAGNTLLHAALNSMSYAFSVWDEEFNLVLYNQIYDDMYYKKKRGLKPGMSLGDVCALSVANGNHPGITGEELSEKYRKRFSKTSEPGAWRPYEKQVNGRIIRATHIRAPEIGWIVTHEDVTDEIRQKEIKKEHAAQLAAQHTLFITAVNNMSHGLSMFDADRKLVICNQAYVQMYDLPEALIEPGTSFWDMLDHGAECGMVSIADRKERYRILDEVILAGVATKGPVTMLNGKIMLVGHQPLEDGGWLAIHEDVTEQYHNEELVSHLAHHDGLTGLSNRTAFLEMMAEAEVKIRAGTVMAVLCIDLDRFKPINDSFGHAAGDAVLCMVAERLARQLGERGIAARLGGDEFAALIGPVFGPGDVGEIAQRILADISQPYRWEGVEVTLSASIGIAMAPRDGDDTDTLMRHGDLALYRAKSDKRGEYCFFEPEMDEMLKKRRSIEAGLKVAMARNELQLYYQPLLSLETNKVSCCEALMRWNSAERGMISPAEFIPIAEETGLIREFGNWALQRACATAVQWPDDVRVAVNVSPVQFTGTDLVVQVDTALERSGLDAGRLELEITESLFLTDNAHNLEILHALRRLGVRISMDDFGTGYSSLSYLRSYPFDKIKVDRSFISSLSEQPANIAIIKAIVDLGKSMDMSITAEGIETEAQLEAVQAQGCTEVQGYLFSPPLPESAIGDLLRAPAEVIKQRRTS